MPRRIASPIVGAMTVPHDIPALDQNTAHAVEAPPVETPAPFQIDGRGDLAPQTPLVFASPIPAGSIPQEMMAASTDWTPRPYADPRMS